MLLLKAHLESVGFPLSLFYVLPALSPILLNLAPAGLSLADLFSICRLKCLFCLLGSFLFYSCVFEHSLRHYTCKFLLKILHIFRLDNSAQSKLRSGCLHTNAKCLRCVIRLLDIVSNALLLLRLLVLELIREATFNLQAHRAPLSGTRVHLLQRRNEQVIVFNYYHY